MSSVQEQLWMLSDGVYGCNGEVHLCGMSHTARFPFVFVGNGTRDN